MYDAEQDDTAAFERRLDAVCKEIGDRGKLMVPEAVPLRDSGCAPAVGAARGSHPGILGLQARSCQRGVRWQLLA